jgi:AcrR family transcriptional regulator
MENRVAANNARKLSPKSADKKYELAMHAISSLAELGFARVNLRDIAVRSGVSLGVIHYYFANKTELLIYCVSVYKEEFIADLKELIARAEQPGRLLAGVADFLADTVGSQAHIHRLWYDVRAQAQFDDAFQPVVEEFEILLTDIFQTLVEKMRELKVDCRDTDSLKMYLALDGWFRYYLQRNLMGDPEAIVMLRRRALAELASAFPGV